MCPWPLKVQYLLKLGFLSCGTIHCREAGIWCLAVEIRAWGPCKMLLPLPWLGSCIGDLAGRLAC